MSNINHIIYWSNCRGLLNADECSQSRPKHMVFDVVRWTTWGVSSQLRQATGHMEATWPLLINGRQGPQKNMGSLTKPPRHLTKTEASDTTQTCRPRAWDRWESMTYSKIIASTCHIISQLKEKHKWLLRTPTSVEMHRFLMEIHQALLGDDSTLSPNDSTPRTTSLRTWKSLTHQALSIKRFQLWDEGAALRSYHRCFLPEFPTQLFRFPRFHANQACATRHCWRRRCSWWPSRFQKEFL